MTSAADQIISTVKGADVPTVLINREPTADQMSAYDKLVYVAATLLSPAPSRVS